MKAAWILALTAAPLATLTIRGWLDASPTGTLTATTAAVDTKPAAAIAEKKPAWIQAQKGVAAALVDVDPLAPTTIAGLDSLPPDSPLGSLRRTWPVWNTARNLAGEFLGLAGAEPQGSLDNLQNVKRQWEDFRQKLEAAKLPASSVLSALVEQRIGRLGQQIARLEAQAEAMAAAEAVKGAFAAGRYDDCLTRSREWITKYAGTSPSSLVEQIKTLGLRAEFQSERQRSRARLKAAVTRGEREAVLVAFLDRFSSPDLLEDSDRAVLVQCRRYLEALRAESAAQERLRAANEAIRVGMADLPSRFDKRVALAARILEKHPEASVKAALRGRVQGWLEESLPEKTLEEPPDLREAETKDGRILRGYFREVSGPGGDVGYKRYDTLAERENPTADVGTWSGRDLTSSPGPSVARRLVERYRDARVRLVERPERTESWESFAASCDRLQAELDAYRAKPGSGETSLGFRQEAQFAGQLLSGSALNGLKAILGESKQVQPE
jgi:hypothetical protein